MQKLLSITAILVSVFALILVYLRPPVETSGSPNHAEPRLAPASQATTASSMSTAAELRAELDVVNQRMRTLQSELAGLRAEQEVFAANLASKPGGDGPVAPLELHAGANDDRQVAESLVDLEQKTMLLEKDLVELGVFEHFEKKAQELKADYDRVFDEAGTTKERITAAMNLKKADRIDADVAATLIGLWDQTENDPYATYFLLDSLEGVVDAGLRDQIFAYLPETESPKMRLRAVQTLEPMLEDPEVERWFEYLAENDPDEKVRESVARHLQRGAEPQAK